jgi:hypothetical protein
MDAANATIAWAEAYAAAGWRLLPLAPGDKRPMLTNWPNAATSERAILNRWFRDGSRNVGVVTGEQFDCFDIESQYLPALHAYMKAGDYALPLTPVQNTGRGGLHFLTRPVGVAGTRRLVLDGVHIGELKSRGGFIVVSPSITERQYTWQFAPAGMVVAAAPAWLLALVDHPAPPRPTRPAVTTRDQRSRTEALARWVARQVVGNRNNCLFWAAMTAVDEWLPEALARPALYKAALDAGEEPAKAERTLRSAFDR